MGLLTAGLLRVFEEIAEQAERELFNEDGVKAELMDLYLKLQAGALSEAEFEQREALLVQRLAEIGERLKQRNGRGTR